MTVLVLGYTENGRTAQPTVLYAGTDAGAGSEISFNPPAGYVRTELIKNPVIARRRSFELPAPEVAATVQPELVPDPPAKKK